MSIVRVVSRIFSLGKKIGSVGGWGSAVVGYSNLGGSGGMPPPPEFFLIEPSESGSETVLRSGAAASRPIFH